MTLAELKTVKLRNEDVAHCPDCGAELEGGKCPNCNIEEQPAEENLLDEEEAEEEME